MRRSGAGEAGTALLGSAAGVAVFLVLLLFAVQLLVNLYATSTVTALGLDAARAVASKDVDHADPGAVRAAQVAAEAELRRTLGGVGESAEVIWAEAGPSVRLHVEVDAPGILPRSLFGRLAFGRIERTFVVRIEELR